MNEAAFPTISSAGVRVPPRIGMVFWLWQYRQLSGQPARLGHDRGLERGVGPQPDDQVEVLVDAAGGERVDGGGRPHVHVVDAAGDLLREHPQHPVPDFTRCQTFSVRSVGPARKEPSPS
ncbi:hypothetical protein G3I68_08745 [Streptomyces sp. SID13588]|nr:hypothetical protein [Streptomyces sp. SID13588]